jgi:hypothetical protein
LISSPSTAVSINPKKTSTAATPPADLSPAASWAHCRQPAASEEHWGVCVELWEDADTEKEVGPVEREKLREMDRFRSSRINGDKSRVTPELQKSHLSSPARKILTNQQRRATGLGLASPKYWRKLNAFRIFFHLPQSPVWRFFRHHGWLLSTEQRGELSFP